MARTPRIVLPHHPHHVVLRGSNRRALFSYQDDFAHFLYQLGRGALFSKCEINGATLMTNHVHLVVTPPDELALAKFVKHVAQRYAQRRNQLRRGSGHQFEARFFSRPIRTDLQLALTLQYIDLNPVRAGISRDAGGYRWSTYGLHAATATSFPSSLWTPTHWYLGLAATRDDRATKYAQWVRDCHERHARPTEPSAADEKATLKALTCHTRIRRPDGTRAA